MAHGGPAGYSGTPLSRKLGLKPEFRVAFHDAPRGFRKLLGRLPRGVTVVPAARGTLDLVMLFATEQSVLVRQFSRWAGKLAPAGMLWVAWPKKAGRMRSDLDFASVQRVGLDAGLVDTKICAIDESWSGLRFVRRLEDRR